jgi:hypothetical protein
LSSQIVALNADQFGSGYPGPNCGKSITLKYGGKTATAKIMDRVYAPTSSPFVAAG